VYYLEFIDLELLGYFMGHLLLLLVNVLKDNYLNNKVKIKLKVGKMDLSLQQNE
jgi:hypothetical protein